MSEERLANAINTVDPKTMDDLYQSCMVIVDLLDRYMQLPQGFSLGHEKDAGLLKRFLARLIQDFVYMRGILESSTFSRDKNQQHKLIAIANRIQRAGEL